MCNQKKSRNFLNTIMLIGFCFDVEENTRIKMIAIRWFTGFSFYQSLNVKCMESGR